MKTGDTVHFISGAKEGQTGTIIGSQGLYRRIRMEDGSEWNERTDRMELDAEEETCPDCNAHCGHDERGYCIDDECPRCGEWLENCDCNWDEE